MSIICFGSLAFDRMMVYPGLFADSLIAEKLDKISVCFLVDYTQRAYGGTAGNIAYNLTLLNEKPTVVASLGDDPDGRDYINRLTQLGLSTEALMVAPGQMTAGATIGTDSNNNQLLFFHPGAMNTPSGFDPSQLEGQAGDHLAIVSPGGAAEMKSLCETYNQLGLPFVFDPGQQIPAFSGADLISMLDGSQVFICNEYEFELYKKISGLSLDEMFCRTSAVVVTLGAKGADLMVPGRGSQRIMAAPIRSLGNPTGAGDGFRSGLLKALAAGESMLTACRLGTVVAAFCVESLGTQEHTFSPAEVVARYASVFKDHISL
ncbi:MAG: carbohydrate kinase family protein [Candidatus Adiutrix sp.]